MTSDTYHLSEAALKATRIDFPVAEGPFSTTAQELLSYADRVELHVKFPPLAQGGRFGQCSYTLRFWAAGTLFYRVRLGRQKSEMTSWTNACGYREHAPMLARNAEDIMWLWLHHEDAKTRALTQDFHIHKVIIKRETIVTKVIREEIRVNEFDKMDDLEVLQRLNARSKATIAAVATKNIVPTDARDDTAPTTINLQTAA